ncbi:sensor histidine kinase [Modestobacter sp. Leaf380]|uniref:sensor histidine kinase n=1 Tax=Modestobacter sp. Leaf380 TaxID=1736356 RepID=UPI0006FC1ADA|nr:histidine kinase [Modestobacter sp. Leaf380]KQS64009.1 hypothetical protein ASG41_17610 [Modestobacter sp. Leaf380]
MSAVPTVSRWWRTRTDPQRIELYTRWSYYAAYLGLPPLLLFAVAPGWSASGLVLPLLLVVGTVATALACTWLTRAGLDARAAAPASMPTAGQLAVVGTVAGLTAVVAVAAVTGGPEPTPSAPGAVGMLGGAVLMALSVTWSMRRLTWASLGCGALATGVALVDGALPGPAVASGVAIAIALVAVASAFRFTVWILEVVQEMDRTRGVQLQLAVAEERLRFARDLHDVMGRNLSAIAVKSQLAAELTRRGRDGAAEEMDGVGSLAESSLREVREVVRGYRATDLASELAGARSVLRSAGVTTTVTGEDDVAAVPAATQELLGWVVREAVTNVLRHSSAGRCDITLTQDPGGTILTVHDDGAGAPTGWGNGLTGLAERLAAGGGRLEAGPADTGFTVRAGVPA